MTCHAFPTFTLAIGVDCMRPVSSCANWRPQRFARSSFCFLIPTLFPRGFLRFLPQPISHLCPLGYLCTLWSQLTQSTSLFCSALPPAIKKYLLFSEGTPVIAIPAFKFASLWIDLPWASLHFPWHNHLCSVWCKGSQIPQSTMQTMRARGTCVVSFIYKIITSL